MLVKNGSSNHDDMTHDGEHRLRIADTFQCSQQQQQQDKIFWKFPVVSTIAATADLVEKRAGPIESGERGTPEGSGQGSNAIQTTETRQIWK